MANQAIRQRLATIIAHDRRDVAKEIHSRFIAKATVDIKRGQAHITTLELGFADAVLISRGIEGAAKMAEIAKE